MKHQISIPVWSLPLVAVVFIVLLLLINGQDNSAMVKLVSEQAKLSHRLILESKKALNGDKKIFVNIKATQDEVAKHIVQLEKMKERKFQKWFYANSNEKLLELVEKWKLYFNYAGTVLENENAIRNMYTSFGTIEKLLPELLSASDEVSGIMTEAGANTSQVYAASRQLMLIPRIQLNGMHVLDGNAESADAADRFGRDVALFRRVLDALINGDSRMRINRVNNSKVQDKLSKIKTLLEPVHASAMKFLDNTPAYFTAMDRANTMYTDLQTMHEQSLSLLNSYH